MKNTVLSCGMGVQTNYLALALTKKYRDERIYNYLSKIINPKSIVVITADTGSEKPETINYFNTIVIPELQKNDIPFYLVKSDLGSLHEWYNNESRIPMRVYRECTDKFKLRPIARKVQELFPNANNQDKTGMIIGISYDELHRMKPSRIAKIQNIYPLVDLKITREEIKLWFVNHELLIPEKSGCFCCPFQRKSEWLKIQNKHPNLIDLSMNMEAKALEKYPLKEKGYTLSLFRDNVTLNQFMQGIRNQSSLNDWFEENKQDDEVSEWSDEDECEGACFL